MNVYLAIICSWLVYGAIRALLFRKLEISALYSFVPGYGTYLLYKRVWKAKWFWVYIGSLASVTFIQICLIPSMLTTILFYGAIVLVLTGWTGQAFHTAKELHQNHILGYGLAILYPLFGIIIALKKEKTKTSLESE